MASTEPKSYDLNRFNVDREMERLRTQALLGWRQESRILTMFGLQDGMSVLEPGNGPGFITEALLTGRGQKAPCFQAGDEWPSLIA